MEADVRAIVMAMAAALLAGCAHHSDAEAGAPNLNGEWIEATRAAHPPTISFADNGASGFAGCNRWFAVAVRDETALRFDGAGATRMACEEPMMRIEQNFLSVLERTRAYRIEGRDTLVLLDESGAELGRFLRAR